MGESTVRKIVHDVCEVLWDVLSPEELPTPGENDWKQHAQDFQDTWNLPHCVGALDGKHIEMFQPPNAGSRFFNYKGHHSIVLLAVVGADYRFICVDIGQYGSISDGGVFKESAIGKLLTRGQLQFPDPEPLPDDPTGNCTPFFLVADDAFPLRIDILKPYSQRLKPWERLKQVIFEMRVFNYRLSRARMVVECAFGILAARFRIFYRKIQLEPDKVEGVVKACVVLHNYLTKPRHIRLIHRNPAGEVQFPPPVKPIHRQDGTRATDRATNLRNTMRWWVNGPGKVDWQIQAARAEYYQP